MAPPFSMGLNVVIRFPFIVGFDMDKEIINLLVEGTPGLGKRLLLEKIAGYLRDEGFSVTEPMKHEKLGSWFIEVLDFENTTN
jgi:nucleoside-triphosphatase THEP1